MDEPVQDCEPEATTDFGALRRRVFAKRWWLLTCTGLATAIFAAVAFYLPPVYRASVVLAPATSDHSASVFGLAAGQLGGLASGLGLGPRDADTEEALAVLRSREFTENFIMAHKLMPKLFWKEWDARAGSWTARANHPPTSGKAYKYFDREVRSIVPDRKTGLVTIQIDWTDRNDAAAWANGLVNDLNDEMRARAIAKADASKEFLDRELQTTSTVEARNAISHLIEAQVKQRMLAHVTHDYSFRVVDRAIAADIDDRVAPHRGLMIMLGALLGLVMGCALALLWKPAR